MLSYNRTQANAGQPSIRSRFDWLEVFCSMLLFSLVWFLSELPTTWGVCLESRASSSFSNALASSSVSCEIRKGSGYSWQRAASVYWLCSLQDAFNLMQLVVVSENSLSRSDHMHLSTLQFCELVQLPRHYIRVQFELAQVTRPLLLCA